MEYVISNIRSAARASGAGLFSNLYEAVRRQFERNATRRELSALSTRQLRDIGIERHQIEFVAEAMTSNAGAARELDAAISVQPVRIVA